MDTAVCYIFHNTPNICPTYPPKPMPHTPILQFQKLHKTFQEGERTRYILQNVTADFYEGQFTLLLGPSGSGKSTLLNLACGIEAPTSGEVWLGGRNITALSDHNRTIFRRDQVGFVFQFFNLIPTLTVLENIILPQELAGKRAKEVTPRAMQLLEQVGLADRRDSFPDKLSGGEQQRVAIARALAHNPAVVLADEPTGNLDIHTGEKVMALLLSLTRQEGKTLIMATHSPEIVPLGDRVLRVHEAKLIETMSNE
jgi:putative ABC transport system ATP-binding protein